MTHHICCFCHLSSCWSLQNHEMMIICQISCVYTTLVIPPLSMTREGNGCHPLTNFWDFLQSDWCQSWWLIATIRKKAKKSMQMWLLSVVTWRSQPETFLLTCSQFDGASLWTRALCSLTLIPVQYRLIINVNDLLLWQHFWWPGCC